MKEQRTGYEYLKYLEEHIGKESTMTSREKLHISSEIDRRTASYRHLCGLLTKISNSDDTDFLSLYDTRKYHLTHHRR